jgi:predicted RecB family nuclease
VELTALARPVSETAGQIRGLAAAKQPPPLVLNRHCGECEFRGRCRAAAVEKDDLSLLSGVSAKEVAALNARGVFTVTQLDFCSDFSTHLVINCAQAAGASA